MSWSELHARRLGTTVQRLRRKRGLSQESLAFQAGITKNQVQLIESGRASGRRGAEGPSNPRLSTLTGLAAVLNMSVSEMLAEARL